MWEEHSPETAARHLSCVLVQLGLPAAIRLLQPCNQNWDQLFQVLFNCMHRTCSHSSKFPVVIPILLLCSERVLAASLPQGKNIFCISFPQDCHSTSSKMNCTPFVVDTGRMDWTLNYSTHKSRWKKMCGEKFYSITPLRACSALFIAFWTLLFYPFQVTNPRYDWISTTKLYIQRTVTIAHIYSCHGKQLYSMPYSVILNLV